MTTKYTLLITSSPSDSLAIQHAISFAEAIVSNGHSIDNIFFYMDGVNNANTYARPMSDEFNFLEGWQKLSEKYQVPLLVCVTAAEKRGIVKTNVSLPFQTVGLSDFFERLHNVNKLVQL